MKHGKPMCRFTGSSGHVMYTEGIFVHSKKAEQVNDTSKLPNSIRCTTPVWTDSSKVKLDLSLNGYDFSGDIDYTFGDLLLLHRVVPMAGPISTSTQSTRLLGQGFRPTMPTCSMRINGVSWRLTLFKSPKSTTTDTISAHGSLLTVRRIKSSTATGTRLPITLGLTPNFMMETLTICTVSHLLRLTEPRSKG